MSQTSQLSRYRPAVLAVTSIAAAFGVYYLYNAYNGLPEKATLHRSNAVHRPRADQRLKLEVTPPDESMLLGNLVIQRGRRILMHDLSSGRTPTKEAITDAVGDISEDSYTEATQLAVYGILLNCVRIQTSESRERIASTLFADLPELLAARDDRARSRCRDLLVSKLPNVDLQVIDRALESFICDHVFEFGDDLTSDATGVDIAETEDLDRVDSASQEPSQGIKGLLYYIAEEDAKRKAYEHRGICCEECGETPIRGVRWHCLNCPDFDLCSTCESTTVHQKTHVMAKIKIPLPVLSQPCEQYPLWYPGDPRKLHSPLDASVRKRLSQQYAFEGPNIDALYDQFTCIANVPWTNDPEKVHAAIDRRAFNKALTPERWPQTHAPNAIHDRVFAFYDTDGNGLIGFEEFLSGLSYLRGPKRYTPLRRALNGFDIDGDGFVDRSDFLRLSRAKYTLQHQWIRDMVEGEEHEQTMAAMDILRSSQPISAVFNQEEIPQGEERPRRGKQRDALGDMRPLPGTKIILGDHDPWPKDQQSPLCKRGGRARVVLQHEQLRHHLSRFEELLYGSSEEGDPVSAQDHQTPSISLSGSGTLGQPDSQDEQQRPVEAAAQQFETHVSHETLLQVVEIGLNDMLDPIFKAKEDEHREATSTRDEREKFCSAIESVQQEKRAFHEDLRSAAMVDPLLATALESYATVDVKPKRGHTIAPAFRAQLVPTDADSLAKREADIVDRPLEELLQAAGYGTVDGVEPVLDEATGTTPEGVDLAGRTSTDGRARHAGPIASLPDRSRGSPDPTMPQNKPDSLQPFSQQISRTSRSVTIATSLSARALSASPQPPMTPPSRQRLEHLAALGEVDREITDRGGPGRLSIDEIEGMVHADTTKELRGLVISWLEWASF